MSTIHLRNYPNTPLYNIKAVVQATGITSSTLRAWERRYQVTQPQRSDSGYRLYSDRDILLIRWLKTQVDAGMAISQAVSWLETLAKEAGGLEQVSLPLTQEVYVDRVTPITQHMALRDYETLQKDLLTALLEFSEERAEEVLAEAFSLYPLELVGEKLIAPVLIEIGDRWHKGLVSVTTEHYASSYLQHRLAAILRTIPNTNGASLIWVGCAPKEEHEIGSMLLTIYLRRAGYHVQYIGKNLKAEDFVADVRRRQPAMVLLSASTEEAAKTLGNLTKELAALEGQRPILGYGGRVFKQKPALRDAITGIYMGESALEAIDSTNELLGSSARIKPDTVEHVYASNDEEIFNELAQEDE